jgi:predicted glycogen debranching enzyme
VVKALIEIIRDGRVKNLVLESNALLSTHGEDKPVTWLSASIQGKPIIPRTGFVLEFNSLWYNALCFAQKLFDSLEEERGYVEELRQLSDRVKESFLRVFLNNNGYLNDYVTPSYTDPEVRPNMAIAIGLDYSPLDRRQRKKVLDFCTRELLTPKGLRSLSPRSPLYTPVYVGNPIEREYAVHRGPARPWLFGFYAQAYINVFGPSGLGFIERMLIGYEDEMMQGCVGSLSEMYDGNPPYTGRGAVSTAKNVGEILRTIKLMKEINRQLNSAEAEN